MALVIDGPTLEIRLDMTTFNYSADQIYSFWKQWVLDGNSNWPKAFDVIGGDPTGGSERAPSFYFLRNDNGWRLKKPEATIDVTVDGNFIGRNTQIAVTREPDGLFNPTITFNRTSVSGVSSEEIANAVWAVMPAGGQGLTQSQILGTVFEMLADIEDGHDHKELMRLISAVLLGQVSGGNSGVETFKGVDGITDRVISNNDENGNRTSVQLDVT